MSGIKLSSTLGGILLAAEMGLPIFAQDPPIIIAPGAASSEQSGFAPIIEPSPEMGSPAIGSSDVIVESAPRPGWYARFMQRYRSKCWGYPEEFVAPRLGASLDCVRATQIINGQGARMVLYQYDFLSDTDQLSSRGKAKLAKIATWLPTNLFPILVEPSPTNSGLDEIRRQTVWRELAVHQCLIPFERVILGRPDVLDLYGSDALLVDRNRMNLTSTRGGSSAAGGTATSSSSSSAANTGAMSGGASASGGSTGRGY